MSNQIEMKKTIITSIIAIFGLSLSQAQIAIGKDNVSSPSVSIEFADTEARGIILPWVDDTASVTDAVDGTIVYDVSDHKIKVKYQADWFDLSVDETGTTVDPISGTDGYDIQDELDENLTAKVGIGTETATAGLLVLEDTDKAMVLPKVADTDEIINPTPGMMVYVTSENLLAVFNGSVWTFWKAGN